ncbi:MAG: iron ABC transporter permease [Phycisphaerales bacterium]|nr:MAG: iron ABC transporter permease [Phycisphaerales bacterium]
MKAGAWRTIWQYALLGGLLALLTLFLLVPIALTVRGGFADDPASGTGWTLRHLQLVFEDPALVQGLVNALQLAVVATSFSILLALPLAIVSARYKLPGKAFWNAAVLVPLILPPFVGALGMKAILGRQGMLNSFLGTDIDYLGGQFDVLGIDGRLFAVAFVIALHLYPIIYLNATAALANLDPALDEAAENLGAGGWKRLIKITLPLIRPGLFAGSTIVFIWAFTELGTPLIFDYTTTTPVQIFYGLQQIESSAEPYALTVVLLTSAVIFYLVGKIAFGGKAYAMYAKASRAGSEKTLPWWGSLLAVGGFAFVTLLAVLPHLGVVLVALTEPGQWYRTVLPTGWTLDHFDQALSAPDSFNAIKNSLQLSAMAVILNIGLGILIGYIIVRTKLVGRNLLDSLCMLPLAVPGLVMAFGYVALTLQWPVPQVREWLAGQGFSELARMLSVTSTVSSEDPTLTPNPFLLLTIAYAVRRLPYIVRSTVAGLEQTSGELEEAAVNLGASRITAVRKIIVPLIMANLIAGGLLVFSFSMLEVSDSLILAQQEIHYPLTKAIYAFTMRLGDGPYIASALGVWGMALLATALFGASLLLGKKLGAIFRV